MFLLYCHLYPSSSVPSIPSPSWRFWQCYPIPLPPTFPVETRTLSLSITRFPPTCSFCFAWVFFNYFNFFYKIMISFCNLLEIPLNRYIYILNSILILIDVRESRKAWFFECNVKGSGRELEMRKEIELSCVPGGLEVKISKGSTFLWSDNWYRIQ
jgi:hypothetical protein